MAGDWIKMRSDLRTHPKVVLISSRCQRDIFGTIGGLHSVWCVFDAHSTDGILDGYTPETMDAIAGFPGLIDAMASVGWMTIEPGRLICPRFDSHNSKSAKNRSTEQEKKRNQRKAKPCPEIVPVPSGQMSRSERDEIGTREEKRREEKSTSTAGAVDVAPPAKNEFLPPTFDELEFYAHSVGAIPEVVQGFYDYFCENGWKTTRGPMADWRAAFRRWMRNEKERPMKTKTMKGTAENERLNNSIDALSRFAARHSSRSSEGPGSPLRIEEDV